MLTLRISLILASAAVAACSVVESPRQLRGNRVDADQVKELVPGTSTRNDVQALLGSPSAKATFDDNTWIYIGGVTHTRVGRTPGLDSQNVVVMKFDQGGVLRDVKSLDKEDSRSVDVVSRTTPSPGSEASFLQQLLGNVGRFSTGGLSASRSPGGSGANPASAPQ